MLRLSLNGIHKKESSLVNKGRMLKEVGRRARVDIEELIRFKSISRTMGKSPKRLA